ncbi:hypothetical protein [Mediterraneibacter gnavus]|uniref:hypothetical protein n=1 Tax=Mediterraneibacter gnavus TaxID=33038 RepID=UPI000464CA88|nr:hypothetical protein [Mediterraneibacter gnavus]
MRAIVLQLLKDRLGISTDSRDSVLYAIIDGILDECENVYGVRIKEERYGPHPALLARLGYVEVQSSRRWGDS